MNNIITQIRCKERGSAVLIIRPDIWATYHVFEASVNLNNGTLGGGLDISQVKTYVNVFRLGQHFTEDRAVVLPTKLSS